VDVIGLDGERQDNPATLSTLPLDQLAAARHYWPHQHRLAAFGPSDEAVDDQVDAILVALILHVEVIEYDNNEINNLRLMAD
jgi:hypothetical protein